MKLFAFSLVVLILFPSIPYAQPETEPPLQAIADARTHAEQDVSTPVWFIAGAACCIFGIGFAYMNQPQVPVHRLMGKSPEYIAVYTDEYHRVARHKQLGLSLGGCVFGSIAFIALSLISPSN